MRRTFKCGHWHRWAVPGAWSNSIATARAVFLGALSVRFQNVLARPASWSMRCVGWLAARWDNRRTRQVRYRRRTDWTRLKERASDVLCGQASAQRPSNTLLSNRLRRRLCGRGPVVPLRLPRSTSVSSSSIGHWTGASIAYALRTFSLSDSGRRGYRFGQLKGDHVRATTALDCTAVRLHAHTTRR